MTRNFYYTLNKNGTPLKYGVTPVFGNEVDGTEPFTEFDIINWRKDLETNEWIYDPIIMIPENISKLQATKHLLNIGRYEELMTIIDSDETGETRKLFDAAHQLDRDSSMVNQIGEAMGFTPEELDTLFVEASKIMV